jgi:lipoprotein-anchoring transpeptidase ErfK/SrfK
MTTTVSADPRALSLRRGLSALTVILLATIAAGANAQVSRAAAPVPASEPLVVLLHDRIARTKPDANAHRIERVSARRPLTKTRTVLPVLGHATSSTGASWVRVALPGRPNGREGWMTTAQTRTASTAWRLSVKLGARRVTVYYSGHVVHRFRAIVGAPSTPTPRGRYFVEEALALRRGASGAPFALATSARSTVLQEFEGGPGQIALHGTGNLSGRLGTAVSHGCVRLSLRAITWMARRIGAGVPLTIVR